MRSKIPKRRVIGFFQTRLPSLQTKTKTLELDLDFEELRQMSLTLLFIIEIHVLKCLIAA